MKKEYITDSTGRRCYFVAIYVHGRCVAQRCAGWFADDTFLYYRIGLQTAAQLFKKTAGVAAYCLASDGVYYLTSKDHGASCAPWMITKECAEFLSGLDYAA